LRRFAIVLLALALGAGACSGGDEDIARVGGTTLRLSDIQAYYEEKPAIDDGFRDTLFARITLEALTQALAADFGVALDQAEVDSYYTQFEAAIAQAGATPADLLGIDNASMELVYFNAQVVALREAALEQIVVDPVTVDRLFSDPITLTRVCAQHILVSTAEEAEAASARLAAGEDFAAVADEISLDTQTEGGDLGCTLAGDYIDEFARAALEAPIGEVSGPVETDYGLHLIVVSERSAPTRAEYLADPVGILSETQLSLIWADWITAVLLAADVWVAEEYGTWAGSGIDPPGEGATTTTGG